MADGGRRSVVALAGRRIDAEGADPPRFPAVRIPAVRQRIADVLTQEAALALVASAACGADLVGLEEAERLDLRRRIVLPFSPQRFRDTSVVDRPGDWGASYDRLVAAARAAGDLVVLAEPEGDSAYAAATAVIIEEAARLATTMPGAPHRLVALVVWEGQPRSGTDATAGFRTLAEKAGFELRTVLTK